LAAAPERPTACEPQYFPMHACLPGAAAVVSVAAASRAGAAARASGRMISPRRSARAARRRGARPDGVLARRGPPTRSPGPIRSRRATAGARGSQCPGCRRARRRRCGRIRGRRPGAGPGSGRPSGRPGGPRRRRRAADACVGAGPGVGSGAERGEAARISPLPSKAIASCLASSARTVTGPAARPQAMLRARPERGERPVSAKLPCTARCPCRAGGVRAAANGPGWPAGQVVPLQNAVSSP